MKKIVLVLTIALMGIVVNAQPPRHHGHHGSPEQMIERRVERLEKALGLTEVQKAEITKIYTTEMEAMSKNRPERTAQDGKREKPDKEAMKARHEKMEAKQAAMDAKIEALLTPEQAAKFAKMKKQEQAKRADGRLRDGKKGPKKGHKKGQKSEGCCPEGSDCCKSGK